MLISSSYGDESYDAIIVSPNCGDRGEDGKETKGKGKGKYVVRGGQSRDSYHGVQQVDVRGLFEM